MTRRLSILFHCQHLSGTGHFVRAYEIARVLAESHDVRLLDGGRPVPRTAAGESLRFVSLPRIMREDGELRPLNEQEDVTEVMRKRTDLLREVVEEIQPDVLIVEHFPFSKWELEAEIMATIAACREARPDVLVVCSLRDIVTRSRYDPDPETHAAHTLSTLHDAFDGVLIHADPRVTRIEEHLAWADRIEIPVRYTGYVTEKPAKGASDHDDSTRDPGLVLVSGGGADDGTLAERCLHAWRALVESGDAGDREMIVILPPFADTRLADRLTTLAARVGARVRPFGTDFLAWLGRADLSVSQAGYNTCANILQTRTRALLVPNERMSDQVIRAKLLAERGLAKHLMPEECTPEALAMALCESLADPRPHHEVDLEGAIGTAIILEAWQADRDAASGDPASSPNQTVTMAQTRDLTSSQDCDAR